MKRSFQKILVFAVILCMVFPMLVSCEINLSNPLGTAATPTGSDTPVVSGTVPSGSTSDSATSTDTLESSDSSVIWQTVPTQTYLSLPIDTYITYTWPTENRITLPPIGTQLTYPTEFSVIVGTADAVVPTESDTEPPKSTTDSMPPSFETFVPTDATNKDTESENSDSDTNVTEATDKADNTDETASSTDKPTEPDVTAEPYVRVDENGEKKADGDHIIFGSYPQSEVKDEALKATLNNLAGELPAGGNAYGWTSYQYRVDGNISDYMWYQDVENLGEKYRAVYFTRYRCSFGSSTEFTWQDDNGYNPNTVYWFKYEPVKWRIVQEQGGKAMLLATLLVDSQEFHHTSNRPTSNNYENSSIRAWLNSTFYNTVFSDLQKELVELSTVDNSISTTATAENSYLCNNTQDKVFLLSYKDVVNEAYGFCDANEGDDPEKQIPFTDYAKCQGGEETFFGNWWLRTPSEQMSMFARTVSLGMADYHTEVICLNTGVRPALWIKL